MSDKPKPCPFCGDTEPFPTHCDPNCCDSVRWFECKCGAMASNEVTWNTRPLEAAKDAEIKRLREALEDMCGSDFVDGRISTKSKKYEIEFDLFND